MNQTRWNRHNCSFINYMLFLFLAQIKFDFCSKVGNIGWIAANEAKKLGIIMGVRPIEGYGGTYTVITHAAIGIKLSIVSDN